MVSTKGILGRLLYKLSYVRTLPNISVRMNNFFTELISYSLRFQLHRIRSSNSASATPQNQLHLANASQKKLRVGCDVRSGVLHAFQLRCSATAPLLRIRTSAKSIAPCRMQSLKNLHGGLRCDRGGWHLKQLRHSANQLHLANCIAEKAA